MSKTPKKHGQSWTPAQDQQLRDLARGNTPTRVMGLKRGRMEDSILSRAADKGLSRKPANQSPYGTQKK